jgi:hypothetical protein
MKMMFLEAVSYFKRMRLPASAGIARAKARAHM